MVNLSPLLIQQITPNKKTGISPAFTGVNKQLLPTAAEKNRTTILLIAAAALLLFFMYKKK